MRKALGDPWLLQSGARDSKISRDKVVMIQRKLGGKNPHGPVVGAQSRAWPGGV